MNIQLDELLKNIFIKDAKFMANELNKINYENCMEEINTYTKFKNNMIEKGIAFLTIIAKNTELSDNINVDEIITIMANLVKASRIKNYITIEEDEEN